jgi:carboxyl-terminal processing protease
MNVEYGMEFLRKHGNKISTALLLVAVFIAGFTFGNISTTSTAQEPVAIGDTEAAFDPLYEAFSEIQSRYVDAEDIDVPTLVNGAIDGMVDSLDDQYSGYLNPEMFSQYNENLSGDVEGIGVIIRQNQETEEIEVIEVLDGAAADQAGVQEGDIFIEVDGQNVQGFDTSELATLVRGPAGTDVTITFQRDGDLIELTITRVSFEVPTVESRIIEESNLAYVSLREFNQRASSEITNALDDLNVNEREGLILDLRGNPGGLLSSAVDVGSLFIEDGVILYEVFGDGREQTFEATGDFYGVTVPITVLVDEGSASASELVAGAMQDRDVATLIGTSTFGKGTVQTLRPLSNDGALRLTIARYLLPERRWIHDIGVTPDITIEFTEDHAENGDDPQLQRAIDFLTEGD